MKNILKKLTFFMLTFMVVGCAGTGNSESSGSPSGSQAPSSQSSSQAPSSSRSSGKSSSSSARPSSSSSSHDHVWSTDWSYNANGHYRICTVCGAKESSASHTMSNWEDTSNSSLKGAEPFKSANAKIKGCSVCGYYQLDGDVLPQVKFTFDPNGANADFATVATKNDLSRPKVPGKLSISNCDAEYQFADADCTMKVRGNQTAGWAKKGFKIKLDDAKNLLGLNGGKKGSGYREWVLLADAKDTTLIRTALGLYLSQGVSKDEEQIWVSNFTPVTVYLNNEYWGYYYLAEQKEVKTGRVNLPIPATDYTGVDIGYCFELDHYADSAGANDEASEMKKGADGDPTFRMKYSPKMEQGRPSGPLATGQVNTYTMLSDITDGPTDVHIQADYTNVDNRGQLSNNSTKTSNSTKLYMCD